MLLGMPASTGKYANSISEVRMLLGSTIYAQMGGTLVATTTDVSVAEKMERILGGVRVSGHVPDYAANKQDALVVKGPPRRNTVAALWDGVQIFEDNVSQGV